MSEMALNLTLYTKLDSMRGVAVEMQKSLRVVGDGEKFADLVITVNEDKKNECAYLIEFKVCCKDRGLGIKNSESDKGGLRPGS